MARVIDIILGLIAPLLAFTPQAKSKQPYTPVNYEAIIALSGIEQVSDPEPLILNQVDFDSDNLIAGHSSHSSHSSHGSHYSHRSSYSSPSPVVPSSPPSSPSPSSRPSSKPTTPTHSMPSAKQTGVGKWRATTEWKKDTNRLFYHEVLVILKDGRVLQGLVTSSKNNSIEVEISKSDSGRAALWIDAKDIQSLLWK